MIKRLRLKKRRDGMSKVVATGFKMRISYEFKKYRGEAECMPRWYGVAYTEWATLHDVCYPMPFHWIIGRVRSLYWRFAGCCRSNYLDNKIEAGVKQGVSVLRRGDKHRVRQLQDELTTTRYLARVYRQMLEDNKIELING